MDWDFSVVSRICIELHTLLYVGHLETPMLTSEILVDL